MGCRRHCAETSPEEPGEDDHRWVPDQAVLGGRLPASCLVGPRLRLGLPISEDSSVLLARLTEPVDVRLIANHEFPWVGILGPLAVTIAALGGAGFAARYARQRLQ